MIDFAKRISVPLVAMVCGLMASACDNGKPLRANADESPDRYVGGIVTVNASKRNLKLAAGPFYLTDASLTYGDWVQLFVQPGAECGDDPQPDFGHGLLSWEKSSSYGRDHHGMRFLVRENEVLCVRSNEEQNARLTWAGFRPF